MNTVYSTARSAAVTSAATAIFAGPDLPGREWLVQADAGNVGIVTILGGGSETVGIVIPIPVTSIPAAPVFFRISNLKFLRFKLGTANDKLNVLAVG